MVAMMRRARPRYLEDNRDRSGRALAAELGGHHEALLGKSGEYHLASPCEEVEGRSSGRSELNSRPCCVAANAVGGDSVGGNSRQRVGSEQSAKEDWPYPHSQTVADEVNLH